MIEIRILNYRRAQLIGLTSELFTTLDKLLSFGDANRAYFKSRYSKFAWDGKTHFLSAKCHYFPTGLVYFLAEYFELQKIPYCIVDFSHPLRCVVNKVPETLGGGITLRRDQVQAVKDALRWPRGVIWGATASGKTEVAIAMIEALGRPGTLFLTGRKKLARQTRERFALRLGLDVQDIGFIGEGKWELGTSGVIVAIVSTLCSPRHESRRAEVFENTDVLFIDEAHHSGSHQWYSVIQQCPAGHRYGLTGTPLGRSDGGDMYLEAATGQVIATITVQDLIKSGVIAKPTVVFLPLPTERVPAETIDQYLKIKSDTTWNALYNLGIVQNESRNAVIAQYANAFEAANIKTLILVTQIAHGQELARLITRAEFLTGQQQSSDIDAACRRFETGKTNVLIATTIFDEGIDMPSIRVLILAAGGKSPINTLQRIGRGLRKKKDDNRLLVLDFQDDECRLLRNHYKKRMEICEASKFPVVKLSAKEASKLSELDLLDL